jgi:hypothetical protein
MRFGTWNIRSLYSAGSLLSVFAKYNWNDQAKENGVGRACNTNEGEEECIEDVGGKDRRKEPLGRRIRSLVNIIKMGPWGIGWGGMDWIDLALVRDQ